MFFINYIAIFQEKLRNVYISFNAMIWLNFEIDLAEFSNQYIFAGSPRRQSTGQPLTEKAFFLSQADSSYYFN